MRRTFTVLLAAVGLGLGPSSLRAQGLPVGGEFQINTTTAGVQQDPAVGFDAAGNFVVAWESDGQDGDGVGIVARRFAADATPLGGEFVVNTETAFDQIDPEVAVAADGSFMVVWVGFALDGDGESVQARRFDASGMPLGDELQVNTFFLGDQDSPAVAAGPGGGFIVAWESGDDQDGSLDGVFAQRFDAAGMPDGSEFQVNTETFDDQDDPAVAIDAAGRFVVVWESFAQDGSLESVQGQLFAADGMPSGGEFQVNTTTSDSQDTPSVAMAAGGSFMVTWESFAQDGDGWGVYGRLFDSTATALTGEIPVNTTTAFDQDTSAVSAGPGGFVVAWESFAQDGDNNGVQIQSFATDGLPVGEESQVNVFFAGEQEDPAVAIDPSGNAVVVWESDGQDGSASGIFGQRYESTLFADGFESGNLLAWSNVTP